MTVASTTNRKTYTGDNVTTSFATSPVIFYLSSNLQVRVTVIATGVSTLLTENTHYTVSGGAATGATGTVNLAGGSSPHGALLSTEKLVILRVLPLTQASDFVNNSNSDAEVLEAALDKLTDVDQQLSERQDRAIAFPEGDVSGSTNTLQDASTRAGRLLGFDALGLLTTIAVTVGTSLVDLAAAGGSALIGWIQSGTGAVLRTLRDKVRERRTIKDYGAVCDGVTDDTAAVTAAIAATPAGGTLVLNEGTTLLSGAGLSITKNMILRGMGHGSVLVYNGNGVGITVNSGVGSNGKTKLVDFAITTTAGTPTTGILVTGSTFVTIENVACSVFPVGFDILSSFLVRLTHSQYDAKAIGDNTAPTANTKIGIRMTLCNACVVDGESLVFRTQFGVQLIACSLVTVRDSDIEYSGTPNAGGIGVKITAQSATNSYGNRIESVWFEDNDSAIVLDGSAASSGSGVIGTLISGNEFETLAGVWQAINIIKASKTTIIGGNTSVAAISTITVSANALLTSLIAVPSDFVFGGAGIVSNLANGSGAYTPTLFNTTNLTSSTAYQCQVVRQGNVVTVSGKIDMNPTAAAATVLGISLPIASVFAAAENCGGTAFSGAVAGMGAVIFADVANARAKLQFVDVTTGNNGWFFTFSYLVI